MNRKFQFSIDCGKFDCKFVGKIEGKMYKNKFRNKVSEVSNLGTEIAPNSFILEHENRTFLIGDMLSEEHTDYELSKQNHNHRLSIYLAITRLLEKSLEISKQSIAFASVDLALNIPLNLYKNQQKKSEFIEYIQNNGNLIALSANGIPFTFRINSILLLPEAIGTVYQNMDDYRDKRLLSIDIGSYNTSYLEFVNLVPQYDKMVVSNLGVNILRGKIAETLSSKYGTMITDDVVEQIFKDKYLILNGIKQNDSKEIVENLVNNHLSQIINYGKSRKLSYSNVIVTFVGGGSILLKDFISQYPFASLSPDPQYANALSFLTVLEAKLNVKA